MKTTVTLLDHPEALALAALEFAADRQATARRIAEKIGTDGGGWRDDARRRMATRNLREAAVFLQQAARLVEVGE